ncbi:hypothetical protein CFN78_07330 [Amycolatopsis antarctica]|uniref:Uncharacterized protein n=1 Tax=Amycolatopsis antarctica TaxID=1854586 RepID=A0A263D9M2_9PSEU|nr:IniB N-terminal domain-containing protein [Amycolatopsis antarctica]OZM74075.1 hypothetical protein CFN78_07330 [Amycolatopsis antarctica]
MPQTLQDFVHNLMNDAGARSAFNTDPEGALGAAGLGDVSALDVQEVMPLVLDYTSADGLGGLLGNDATGGFGLDPVEQLQNLTEQFGGVTEFGGSVESNAVPAGLAAITEDLTGRIGTDMLGSDPFGSIDSITGVGTNGPVDPITTVTGAIGDVTGIGTNGPVQVTDVIDDVTGIGTNGPVQVNDIVDDVMTHVGDVTGIGTNGPVDLTENLTDNIDDVMTHVGDVTGIGTNGPVQITDVVDDVTGIGTNGPVDPVTTVTDVLQDNVQGNPITTTVSDLEHVVSNVGVGQISDVNDVIGDINIGGVANGNDLGGLGE